ncbi:MAG: MerR family transcriptional regulator [Anaerolineales bacterium]|nr:MerR family transcriptional regulator [Anaerolineales bacterium]
MFRIGEFSLLAKVTVETLRHYDTLGLLKPAHVDPFTGYRSYTAKQLHPLHQILALKELGFSLEEIARLLREPLTNDQLRGLLKMQLATTERDLENAQARLARIQSRLRYLDLEPEMSTYEITLKSVPATTIASIREIVPTLEQMPERCGAMFHTIAQWMAAQKLPFGPGLTLYHHQEAVLENIDTECAFLLPGVDAARLSPSAPITVRELEALPQVISTLTGDDFYQKVDGLTPVYQALAQWIEANGYEMTGPPRELFYGSPQAGDLTAEVQIPVRRNE